MKKSKQKTVSFWQLFITFFKVGAFTFGGGYAMISILEEELVGKKQWITSDDMLNMVVIAESTPGVIAVNTATSVGYKLRGILGAIIATLGVVLPSFCIIYALSFAIQAFKDNIWYQAAFRSIQACVTVLIINAFVKMSKQLNKDVFSFVLLLAAFGVSTFVDFNAIYIILIGGALGLCYTLARDAILKKRALPLEETQRLNEEKQNSADGSQGDAAHLENSADGYQNGADISQENTAHSQDNSAEVSQNSADNSCKNSAAKNVQDDVSLAENSADGSQHGGADCSNLDDKEGKK